MSKQQDITAAENWFCGEHRTLQVDVKQANGTARQDMTGWTLEWVLRKSKYAVDPTLTKVTPAGVVLTSSGSDAVIDRATVTVDATDTKDLTPGTYYHALRRADAGSETVLVFGTFALQRTATR